MKKHFSKYSRKGLPGGANEQQSFTEGFIVSKRGQWDFPGKPTMIPNANGRITMQGVEDTLFGFDDQGNSQIMYPGGEYQFPGNHVFEIPLPKAQIGFESNPSTVYIYPGRPDAKYKKDGDQWTINLGDQTDNVYIPIKDPTGSRTQVLNKQAIPYQQSQFEKAKQFHQEWLNSPRHNTMLWESMNTFPSIKKGQEPLGYQFYKTNRVTNLNTMPDLNVKDEQPHNYPNTGGWSLSGTGLVEVMPKGQDVRGLMTHEISHSTDRSRGGVERLIPMSDQLLIKKFAESGSPARSNPPSDDFKSYVAEPTETRARLMDIRHAAKERGIYNPFTQKVTPEIYEKLKKEKFEVGEEEGFDALYQLRGVFSDEQIMELLNTISDAQEIQSSNVQIAQEGGEILELTPAEIQEYIASGYTVEELPKAQMGIIGTTSRDKGYSSRFGSLNPFLAYKSSDKMPYAGVEYVKPLSVRDPNLEAAFAAGIYGSPEKAGVGVRGSSKYSGAPVGETWADLYGGYGTDQGGYAGLNAYQMFPLLQRKNANIYAGGFGGYEMQSKLPSGIVSAIQSGDTYFDDPQKLPFAERLPLSSGFRYGPAIAGNVGNFKFRAKGYFDPVQGKLADPDPDNPIIKAYAEKVGTDKVHWKPSFEISAGYTFPLDNSKKKRRAQIEKNKTKDQLEEEREALRVLDQITKDPEEVDFVKQQDLKKKMLESPQKETRYRFQDGGESKDAMNAMMKARLAYANEFGNPAAQRMIVAPDQPYDFGDGYTGTHYMSSMDNYAVPQIQDENGQLVLGDYGPESNEAIRFDNPNDAQYFAKHYKDVSPAFIEMELSPEEIEEYVKGGYIVEELPKAQKGIVDPSKMKRRTSLLDKYDIDPALTLPKPEVAESTKPKNYIPPKSSAANAVKETKQARDVGAQMIMENPSLSDEQKYEMATSPQKSIDYYNTVSTFAENQGTIKRDANRQSETERLLDYAVHPADAFWYYMRGERFPENYREMRLAGIDPIAEYENPFKPSGGSNAVFRAVDAVTNPTGAFDSAYRNISEGNLAGAALDIAVIAPFMKALRLEKDAARLFKGRPKAPASKAVKSKPSQWDNEYIPPSEMGYNPFSRFKTSSSNATSSIDDVGKGFKSEIDWAKWNKEIPENKALMDEYLAIEQKAKANGTWMKNPDGSPFQGTPEQFIQQQSENFKKAFPNPVLDDLGNIQINYHGSPNKFEEFKPALKPTDKTGERLGKGIYTTPRRSKALEYAIKNQNKKGNLYELYQNANNKQTAIADLDNYINDKIEKIKSDFLNNKISNKEANKLYDAVLKENDELWDKIPDSEFKLQKGKDYLRIDDEQIVPFTNYPKSAIGNNGMFDMTNPNIYKALVPVAGAAGVLNTIGNNTEYQKPFSTFRPQYQAGGLINNYKIGDEITEEEAVRLRKLGYEIEEF